jgi:hypothetical protein
MTRQPFRPCRHKSSGRNARSFAHRISDRAPSPRPCSMRCRERGARWLRSMTPKTSQRRGNCSKPGLPLPRRRPAWLRAGTLAIANLGQTGSGLFALEYSGLFRVLIPFLARIRMPIPLGGTSNHFRRSALEATGGWDPYNVTEDADLGLRLYAHGYYTGTLKAPPSKQHPPHSKYGDASGHAGSRAGPRPGW